VLKRVESLVLFVPDVVAAANWYAEIFGAEVGLYRYSRNPMYVSVASVRRLCRKGGGPVRLHVRPA
jgi:hypothetical protein